MPFIRPAWLEGDWKGFVLTAFALSVVTAVTAPLLDERDLVVVALILLVVVVASAALWGYRVGLSAAVAANLLLNFFSVAPLHRFTVQDPRNVAVLALFLVVALVGAWMFARQERARALAVTGRRELDLMLQISRALASAGSPRVALDHLTVAIRGVVNAEHCAIFEAAAEGTFTAIASTAGASSLSRNQQALARRAIETGELVRAAAAARRGARTLRVSDAGPHEAYVPFRSADGLEGVIKLTGAAPTGRVDLAVLLRAFGDEASVALHRFRLAEKALSAEALQRADEVKSALLASVSHDLRSPLTGIKAAVGNLRDEGVNWSAEDRTDFLATIEAQADRLSTMVDDLMEMSTLEAGAVKPNLERVEVAPLLADVAANTALVTRGRDVRSQVGDAGWVLADYGLLFHALTNVVENAAKYSSPGGPICLGAAPGAIRTIFSVADAGPAVPAEQLAHVFEKFYRGPNADGTAGSGLGLAIVRESMRLMGGRAWAESTGTGTVLSLEVPATPGPAR